MQEQWLSTALPLGDPTDIDLAQSAGALAEHWNLPARETIVNDVSWLENSYRTELTTLR